MDLFFNIPLLLNIKIRSAKVEGHLYLKYHHTKSKKKKISNEDFDFN